ncbi:MAG: hypothetical protein PHF86_01255 [Candidatus Nanoarchaeia archaeon]|nr:hypothetical protein [Candidatus Nanoarchaeia archaeon]
MQDFKLRWPLAFAILIAGAILGFSTQYFFFKRNRILTDQEKIEARIVKVQDDLIKEIGTTRGACFSYTDQQIAIMREDIKEIKSDVKELLKWTLSKK